MTVFLSALPSIDGPADGGAVCVGHWVIFPEPSQPIRLVVDTLENPTFLRLVSVEGPPHQRGLATQVLASAGNGHRSDDVKASAEQATRAAVGALSADAAVMDECRVSLAQVVADGCDVAVGVVGDVHTYVMRSGYAAPDGPGPSAAVLVGRAGPSVVTRLELGADEWLLLANQPLESLDAPLSFPPGQSPIEYFSSLATRGRDILDRPVVLAAYLPPTGERAG